MGNSKYYDGTKLLSLSDLDGEKPEIYICTTNRTGGKTTYFGRLLVRRFLKYGEKFALLYRFNYELDDVADKFFKDLGCLFFQDKAMRTERRASGIYHELFLQDSDEEEKGGVSCGYAISINSADQIKKYSHLFSDVKAILFDEFQSETNHYCANEVTKFQSVHTSIARGQGEQVRHVPVFMLSNPVTLLNPYYVALGIASRLRSDTQFLRGHGFVMEQGYVESADEAQKTSGFNRAFADTQYAVYSSQGLYLNDNTAFVDKPTGKSRYIVTVRYNGSDFAIREFADSGFVYCDDRPDYSFKNRVVVTTDDHQVNYIMLKRNDIILSTLRYFFEKGCFRFKDLRCKDAVLGMLSY